MKPFVIVGAGVTGLTIGYELAMRGLDVIIIEREDEVGGLARTIKYGDFAFDIGPHRFNMQYERVTDFVAQILNGDIIKLNRYTGVYFLGKYYSWPLRPDALFHLPLPIALKSAQDLFMKRPWGNEETDFESYVLRNYGPTLYNVFFKNYSKKFLGLEPKETHFEWARTGMKRAIIDERIASRHLVDMLRLMIMPRPAPMESLYPRGGMGNFSNKLRDVIIGCNGKVLTSCAIDWIDSGSGVIRAIEIDGKVFVPDRLIWTGSLRSLSLLLDEPCEGIEYLSTLLFNVELNGHLNFDYQWCYYGDENIIFSRITNPQAFCKEMVPKGRGALCIEVTCRDKDERWNRPEDLFDLIKRDLLKVKLIERESQVETIHIERIRDTYPIYTLKFPSHLRAVQARLCRFKNLILAGRLGLFWYNNMDEAILSAWEVVDRLLLDTKRDEEVAFIGR